MDLTIDSKLSIVDQNCQNAFFYVTELCIQCGCDVFPSLVAIETVNVILLLTDSKFCVNYFPVIFSLSSVTLLINVSVLKFNVIFTLSMDIGITYNMSTSCTCV